MFKTWTKHIMFEPEAPAPIEMAPAIVAYRINNGFVVNTRDKNGFTYCKNTQDIADYIMSSAVMDRLGIQSDLFEKEKQAQSVATPHFSHLTQGISTS